MLNTRGGAGRSVSNALSTILASTMSLSLGGCVMSYDPYGQENRAAAIRAAEIEAKATRELTDAIREANGLKPTSVSPGALQSFTAQAQENPYVPMVSDTPWADTNGNGRCDLGDFTLKRDFRVGQTAYFNLVPMGNLASGLHKASVHIVSDELFFFSVDRDSPFSPPQEFPNKAVKITPEMKGHRIDANWYVDGQPAGSIGVQVSE